MRLSEASFCLRRSEAEAVAKWCRAWLGVRALLPFFTPLSFSPLAI